MSTIEATVVDATPIQGTALTEAQNPYMAMAQQAMVLGKVDQLDKLLDMQLRWDAERARKAFVAAMAAFKAEPMEIIKRKRVEFTTRDGDITSYSHAELSDVADAVVPAMGKHGLSHRWEVKQEGGQITVTCIVSHTDGHSETVSLTAAPDNSGKKNAIQQVASTVTYLQRYTLLMATGMATKGMDDDGRGFEQPDNYPPSAEEQAIRRKALHDEAVGRHSESVDFIKERIAAKDLKAVAEEWAQIPQDDQMALWLAHTKGGVFTTEERRTIKEDLPKKEHR